MCQSLFFNKVAGLRLATLLKNRAWHRCFPMNFVKFKNPFFTEHLWTTASIRARPWYYCENIIIKTIAERAFIPQII